jgi:ATP-dependent Lon protease
LRTLDENSKKSTPYAGAFLVKNEEDNNIHELKGKELLNCLHDVGTLAQVLGSFAKLVGDIFL